MQKGLGGHRLDALVCSFATEVVNLRRVATADINSRVDGEKVWGGMGWKSIAVELLRKC